MRCEDFPCCGHEVGDCPDPNPAPGTSGYRCVGCGLSLKAGSGSSFCKRPECIRDERERQEREYRGEFEDGEASERRGGRLY